MTTERIDTTVQPWTGPETTCARLKPTSSVLMQTCNRPVRFLVWDSAVCHEDAVDRLVELLRAAEVAA